MNKLVASNIYKTYESGGHSTNVLSNISIEISEGDTIGVIGSSGSGKTTLLQILAGLELADQGNIHFNDINLSSNNAKNFNLMRSKLFGYAYQFHYLLDDLTVYENCNLVFKIAGNKSDEKNSKKIIQILDELGISELQNNYPYMLSGGERQRVAIARAVVHEPKFILMDEPTGNLDQENAEIIQDLTIKLAKNRNIGIVVATHDLNYAGKLDAVFRIENGDLKSA
ncbi:ABC transporter ATP-binding protein [Gammaproteobacteria bacterium]|jgi:lipoprotein-releasing system ATP-binding protein|nr:ABC transporter ATP-binding protein [SAR86 cluster bacterium]MDA8526474.1 ABC transporter ATP-binding protein [Gammaproteobacteria bacterium]MBL6822129.1 ABC transporter ATP-binding protein [SAR86 cluster bacterium]MDA9205329.1 ABC transporter ATP-binding protein [Gammaproteobacteria bacterium]MDA9799754.1 ABC transporter ATP-binding protein [Gammaproteobacteria bacterium]|tara:strand:+ start:312 stop:989 length:678 start_codon:yes stop_codon:yes gene_type:complete